MTRIGVDLDGVLCNSNREATKRIKAEFKIDIDENDFAPGHDILEEYGIDSKWISKKLYKDEWFWARSAPYEDNIETIQMWAEFGHDIHIITGRPKDTGIVTRGWLKRNKVSYDSLSFESVMHKVDYLKRLEIPVMFEDMFFEANKIGAFGIRSFIVRRPWNARYEPRVTNPLVTFIDKLSDANNFIGGL